jgi:hypothetical protein
VIFDERQREALRVMAENMPGATRVTDRLAWVDPFCGAVIEEEGSRTETGVDVRQDAGPSEAAKYHA